jgi:enoyl-CoA hydratase/carnithine racemase
VLGEALTVEQAVAAGFVNRVVSTDMLESTAAAAARRLARKPPEALTIARRLMRGDPADILARVDEEAACFRERLGSSEAIEAFTAFFEKRPPRYDKKV